MLLTYYTEQAYILRKGGFSVVPEYVLRGDHKKM